MTVLPLPLCWIALSRAFRKPLLLMVAVYTILGGMLFSLQRPHPERFFLVFGALKLATDLASWLPLSPRPVEKERAATEDDERPRRRRKL